MNLTKFRSGGGVDFPNPSTFTANFTTRTGNAIIISIYSGLLNFNGTSGSWGDTAILTELGRFIKAAPNYKITLSGTNSYKSMGKTRSFTSVEVVEQNSQWKFSDSSGNYILVSVPDFNLINSNGIDGTFVERVRLGVALSY